MLHRPKLMLRRGDRNRRDLPPWEGGSSDRGVGCSLPWTTPEQNI